MNVTATNINKSEYKYSFCMYVTLSFSVFQLQFRPDFPKIKGIRMFFIIDEIRGDTESFAL